MKDMHALLYIALLAGCFFTALNIFNRIIDAQMTRQKKKQWQLWKKKYIASDMS